MRIVDVTQWYAATSGGIRTYLHAKADWAERVGIEHAIVVPGPVAGQSTVAASQLVSLRGRTLSERWGYRMVVRPRPIVDALDELEPDIVVTHDVMGFPSTLGRWAAARGIPLAMFCHSNAAAAVAWLPGPVGAPVGCLLDRLERRAFGVPRVIFASRRVQQRIAAYAVAPVVRVPLGVDAVTFGSATPDPALRRSLADPKQDLLLYVGRLSIEKRVDLLPEILASLSPNTVLAIAGSGAAAAAVQRCAERLRVGDRIRWLGHIDDRTALATLMATADCFVHPNDQEPYGLAPVEAIAARCRVVLPRATGCAVDLESRGAVLVEEATADSLAVGIKHALGGLRPNPDLTELSWDRTFQVERSQYNELISHEGVYAA